MCKINIQILKQGVPSKNVLSCSFFATKDEYREFEKYQSNLTEFLRQQKQISGFEVRIYTDNSGIKFALEASNIYDNVSVYHYNCPDFRDGKWHTGMFGTLCRLLPLFEELDLVWVSDIDIPSRFFSPFIISQLNNEIPVYIDTRVCNTTRKFGRRFPIILHKFISRLKFPNSLLTEFLTDLHQCREQDVIEYMNERNKSKPHSRVPYGMDEYFMNTRIYEYLQVNKVKCLIGKDYLNRAVMQENASDEQKSILKNYSLTHDEKLIQKIKEILKENLPGLIEKHPCCKEALDSLDILNSSSMILYKTLI